MRIDSPANPGVKAALRAVERGERLLLEGSRAIGEALASGIVLREIFLEGEERAAEGRDVTVEAAAARGARVFVVSSRVLRRLSDLPSPRGCVALADPPRCSLADLRFRRKPPSVSHSSSQLPSSASYVPSIPSSSSLFVLLDGVQDPANVGAIVRSAEAFGAAGVILTPDAASPFSPRALRASALSALRIPLVRDVRPEEAVTWARRARAVLAGAAAQGGEEPWALSGIRPLVLVIGSEGHGISQTLERKLALRVTIPLAGRVESLNAAVAAGILLAIASGRAG